MRFLQQRNTDEKVALDRKDRRVLAALCRDARTPVSHIAKEVGLSRDAVQYRIRQLEEHGIIQGYRTLVDIKRFGYSAYHVFLRLDQPTKEVEDKLIAKFKQYPFARAVIVFRGRYDVELALVAKSAEEFDAILDRVLLDCGRHLQAYDVLITTENYAGRTLPISFFPLNIPQARNESLEIDGKDRSLLAALAREPLASTVALAKTLKTSHDAVTYRFKRLREAGVIRRTVPVINYAGLSYSVYALLVRFNGLPEEKRKTLGELLRTDKNVLWAVRCIGSHNLLAYVCVQNSDELNETISRLRAHFSGDITDYELLIAYEEHKYTYFPEYGAL